MIRRNKSPGRTMALLGGVFLVVGIAIVILGVGAPLLKAWQTSGWDERSATVLSASLESSRSSDSATTWSVSARYRYQADGREHIGTRVGLHGGSDNIGTWHQRTVDRLQAARAAGRSITVFVDPQDPTRSIIDPHPRAGLMLFMGLLGLVFGGVGAAVLWFAHRHRASRRAGVRGDGTLEHWPVTLAGRTLNASGRPLRMQLFAVAAWWSFTSIIALVGLLEPAKITNMTLYLGVLAAFGGVGLLILGSTVRSLLRDRRSGPASVTFAGTRRAPPQRLHGCCRINGERLDGATFNCTLSLDERRWRRNTLSTRSIWSAQIDRVASGTEAGVEFDVDFDLPETLLENYRTVPELHLHWVLTVISKRPHVTREFRAAIVTPAMRRDAQSPQVASDRSASAERPVIERG